MAPRARATPAPATTHARRRHRRPASYATLLALGLALTGAGVVVPRTGAVAHVPRAASHSYSSPASARGHRSSSEATEYGGTAGPAAASEGGGQYGSDYSWGGGNESAYFPAPPAQLRAAAKSSPPASLESETRAVDTAVLGPEHAAEHAAVRRAERKWARLGHQPHMQNPKDALSSRGAPLLPNAGNEDPPSVVGEWTTSPFQIPTFAINATVLATGKVLFWGRPPDPLGPDPRQNVGQAAVWSPSMGTGPDAFQDVAPPVIDPDGSGPASPVPAPIFCSGLSQLPDGEVVVAGGTLIYGQSNGDDDYTKNFAGLPTVFTFDPFSETWTQQPNMAHGRWYPTQTELPDGRTIFAGGLSDVPPGGVMNNTVEVFNPPSAIGGLGSIDEEPTADHGLAGYPRLFTIGEDSVLQAGPGKRQVATLNTNTFTWARNLPEMSQTRKMNNAVRQPGGPAGSDTITEIGGFDDTGNPTSFIPATNTTETIDADAQKPAWMPDAPLNVPRESANTVLLPDGSMVTVGGGSGFDKGDGGGYVTYADGRARQVELYDAATKSWRLGPAQQEDRAYHSTAVLLPDGRVFSAGDDVHPLDPSGGPSQTDSAEIYSPPYLFNGPRPQIDSAPQTIRWGDTFGIASASPDIERAVLMTPGATTHGFDMNQRYVKLRVLDTVDGKGVDVVAPPSPAVAPPGYYMLFLINKQGVPSVASWVKVNSRAPDQPLIGSPPAGDFNGDGFPDLAIAAPDEAVGSASGAGVIHVVYGSGSGLGNGQSQAWTQNDVGGGEAAGAGNRFGAALAAGDFNGDGYADLAIGSPGEAAGSNANAGALDILYGSAQGLSASGEQTLSQGVGGIAGQAGAGDRFGAALAAGDLNGDGNADLAAGAPGEAVGASAGAGAVNVIYGSGGGLTATGNQLWTQDSTDIEDGSEAGDSFGTALAAGDLNGDGSADLAVGAPGEGVGTAAGAGAVNVLYGSGNGLTATGNQLWSQKSAGIAGGAARGDSFGAALAAGDLNGDGRADLAAGAPGDAVGTSAGAGAVNVIYGSGGGLTATASQLWTQNSTDIQDRAESGDSLGSALAMSDLNGDGNADLAAGAPGEGVGTAAGAGAVNVIYGSGGGLTAPGNQVWTQNSRDVVDQAEAGDGFGSVISAGDLDRDGSADLAIGVPSESVDVNEDAGAVNLLYGAAGGVTATGNQLWSEDSASVNGSAGPDDRFGAALGVNAP